MRPVTCLWTMIDCLRTSALSPVFRLRQAGVFLGLFCMFLYKSSGVLLVFAWLGVANSGEGATTVQPRNLAGTAAQIEQGGEGQRLALGKGESPGARARTSNQRVHAWQFTRGKIASRVAADRAQHSVNAIGARRVEAAVSIVQREDHQFYVARQASSRNDADKAASANHSSHTVDAGPRLAEAASVGNLFVDQSLLLKLATSSKRGQR